MKKILNAVAITAMILGVFTGIALILSVGMTYERVKEEQRIAEQCKQATMTMATMAICLSDKEFKCFVTPSDFKEFARAAETRKVNNCEVK